MEEQKIVWILLQLLTKAISGSVLQLATYADALIIDCGTKSGIMEIIGETVLLTNILDLYMSIIPHFIRRLCYLTLKSTKLALFADDEDGNEGFAEKRLMIIICYLNKV